MGIAAWALWEKAWPLANIQSRIADSVALLVIIAASGALYFVLAWALRVPNIGEAFSLLLHRRRKSTESSNA